MKQQLTLIETPADWRLDERTRTTGREGLEQARAALRSARRPVGTDEQPAAA